MSRAAFERLQSQIMRFARHAYGRDTFARAHLIWKFIEAGHPAYCGLHLKADGSRSCDGVACPPSACWRHEVINNVEFWGGCRWLRVSDAFFHLVEKERFTSMGDDVWQLATSRAASTNQRSLFEYSHQPDELFGTYRYAEALAAKEPVPVRRTQIVVSRIIRDTSAAHDLKRRYQGRCQVCAIVLGIGEAAYCEVHHLRPLGAPHHGADDWDNMMVLCPNHHALFDYGVPRWNGTEELQIGGAAFRLTILHRLSATNIEYYRAHIQREND